MKRIVSNLTWVISQRGVCDLLRTKRQDFIIHVKKRSLHNRIDGRLRFIDVKSHDAVYNVGYFDEGPHDGATILAVHGCPGGSTDFDVMTKRCVSEGMRIVIPNLPGSIATRQQEKSNYKNSISHRAEFILNFLEAVNLRKFDVIIGHSLGGPSVLHLAATTNITKSIAMFNSMAHLPVRAAKPYWLLETVANCSESRLLRKPIVTWFQKKLQQQGFGELSEEETATVLLTHSRLQFDDVKEYTKTIRDKALPVLYAFCKDDHLLQWPIPMASAKLVGVPEENITFLDESYKVLSGPATDIPLSQRAIVFANGGHHALKHDRIVFKCFMNLINHVRN